MIEVWAFQLEAAYKLFQWPFVHVAPFENFAAIGAMAGCLFQQSRLPPAEDGLNHLPVDTGLLVEAGRCDVRELLHVKHV